MQDGVIFIEKPKNWTSRDVVNQISKIFNTKKVGHTGTLDPIAKGVLIVCLGKYTKLVNLLTNTSKTYIATMKLGIETDTLDITGNIIKTEEFNISEEKIRMAFQNFPKKYNQEVPSFSAIKVKGKKLYEYARKNIKVELPKKEVEIFSLKILEIKKDTIIFEANVSKGTYIRSLIRDLAYQMKTVGTMTDLIRTKQGNVMLQDCIPLEKVTKNTSLKQLKDLFFFPSIEINEEEVKKVQNGNSIKLTTNEETIFLTKNKEPIAIYKKNENKYIMIFKAI